MTDVIMTYPITYKIAGIKNVDKIIGMFYTIMLILLKPRDIADI